MKKRKYCLLLITCWMFCTVTAQELSGSLMDQNNAPVAYANIGVLGKSIGTVSDDNGAFALMTKDIDLGDTIRFSAIGYETLDVVYSDNLSPQFVITKTAYNLPEIALKAGEFNNQKIVGNDIDKSGVQLAHTRNSLGTEIGVRVKNKKELWIKNVKCVIAKNDLDSLWFRVNIYRMEGKKVKEKLLNENVFIKTNIKRGAIEADLSAYNLIVKGDFLISLEWVKDFKNGDLTEGLSFYGGFMKKRFFYREASQAEWGTIGVLGVSICSLVSY